VRAGVPREAVATLEGARARLGLADLGWDDSVSTTASLNGLPAIYDEIAADLAAAP
jgi:hypothetical protein